MKTTLTLISILLSFVSLIEYRVDKTLFITHQVDPSKGELKLYWNNDDGEIYGSFKNLKEGIESKGQKLVFAMTLGLSQNIIAL